MLNIRWSNKCSRYTTKWEPWSHVCTHGTKRLGDLSHLYPCTHTCHLFNYGPSYVTIFFVFFIIMLHWFVGKSWATSTSIFLAPSLWQGWLSHDIDVLNLVLWKDKWSFKLNDLFYFSFFFISIFFFFTKE